MTNGNRRRRGCCRRESNGSSLEVDRLFPQAVDSRRGGVNVCATHVGRGGLWQTTQTWVLSLRLSPCNASTLWQTSHLAMSTTTRAPRHRRGAGDVGVGDRTRHGMAWLRSGPGGDDARMTFDHDRDVGDGGARRARPPADSWRPAGSAVPWARSGERAVRVGSGDGRARHRRGAAGHRAGSGTTAAPRWRPSCRCPSSCSRWFPRRCRWRAARCRHWRTRVSRCPDRCRRRRPPSGCCTAHCRWSDRRPRTSRPGRRGAPRRW
jgi:hypothetical protein